MPDVLQLTLPVDHICHFTGCAEPVVGSSTAKRNAHVCDYHNNIEWARALVHGKSGYWSVFGKRWLQELESEGQA